MKKFKALLLQHMELMIMYMIPLIVCFYELLNDEKHLITYTDLEAIGSDGMFVFIILIPLVMFTITNSIRNLLKVEFLLRCPNVNVFINIAMKKIMTTSIFAALYFHCPLMIFVRIRNFDLGELGQWVGFLMGIWTFTSIFMLIGMSMFLLSIKMGASPKNMFIVMGVIYSVTIIQKFLFYNASIRIMGISDIFMLNMVCRGNHINLLSCIWWAFGLGIAIAILYSFIRYKIKNSDILWG